MDIDFTSYIRSSEDNTRTTAVFAIKHLRSIGFDVNNDLFADNSWYFRNALVRTNYRNVRKDVEPDMSFLIAFFRNLMMGENHDPTTANRTSTEQANRTVQRTAFSYRKGYRDRTMFIESKK